MADSGLFARLQEIFRAEGWKCRRVDGRDVLEAAFGGRSGTIALHAQVFDAIAAIGITAEAEPSAPISHRIKAAELLMRSNLQMTIGNFELDWETGRVYFRVANVFAGAVASAEVILGMVQAAVAETDRMSALLRILAAEPVEALTRFDIARLMRRDDIFPDDADT